MSEPNDEETSSLSLIQQIKDKRVDPRNLDKKQRQECVSTLECEGYNIASIAQILRRSEKTIKRDLAEVHEERTLRQDPAMIRQRIGILCQRAEAHQSFLMRLSRSKEGSVGERSQAEYYAWQVLKEETQLLQSMGILPTRPQEIVGDITHHADNVPLEELKNKLEAIEFSANNSGEMTAEVVQSIEYLKLEITKIETLERIQKLETPHHEPPAQTEE